MKITKVEGIPITLPMRRLTKMQKQSKKYYDLLEKGLKEYVLVKIHTDEGIVGVCDSESHPNFGAEFQEAQVKLIKWLEPVLIGEDVFNVEKIWAKMNGRIRWNIYGKAGIDIALYDAMGKFLKTPVYNLLGGIYREKIPLDYTVWVQKTEDMVKDALKAVENGFKCIRIKTGIKPNTDVEIVRKVREGIGYDINLRVDANCAYSPEVGLRVAKRMEKYDLQMLEDPIYGVTTPLGWNVDYLTRMRRAVSTPILADDIYYTLNDIYQLIKKEAVDIVGIRVATRPGGITFAKKAVDLCEAAGIPCLTLTAIETGFSTSATLQVAAALPNISYECDQDGFPWISPDIIKKPYPIKIKDGFAFYPRKPGLGVELDEAVIEKYTVKKWD